MAARDSAQAWEEPLDIAIALYNDGQYDLCIRRLRVLLADSTLPRYPIISGYALLASALDDWYEAQELRYHAEWHWRQWRFFWPAGDNEHIDACIDELRGILDDLAEDLKAERPEDWMDHQPWMSDADLADRDAELAAIMREAGATKYEEEDATDISQEDGQARMDDVEVEVEAEAEEEGAVDQTETE